jgi:hypothetical protein
VISIILDNEIVRPATIVANIVVFLIFFGFLTNGQIVASVRVSANDNSIPNGH